MEHSHAFTRVPAERRLHHCAGLTLLELLIALAIAAVLSTVAVPTYQSMVTKARKLEVKPALAQIYVAETAFFSEWGAYGSNLWAIGLEIPRGLRYYVVGFPDINNCNNLTAAGSTPRVDVATGQMLNALYPDYYKEPTPGNGPGGQTFISRLLPLNNNGIPYSYTACLGLSGNIGAPAFGILGGVVPNWWLSEPGGVIFWGGEGPNGFRAAAISMSPELGSWSGFYIDHDRIFSHFFEAPIP